MKSSFIFALLPTALLATSLVVPPRPSGGIVEPLLPGLLHAQLQQQIVEDVLRAHVEEAAAKAAIARTRHAPIDARTKSELLCKGCKYIFEAVKEELVKVEKIEEGAAAACNPGEWRGAGNEATRL